MPSVAKLLIHKEHSLMLSSAWFKYQWRLVTFQQRDAVQKAPFIFRNFTLILIFFFLEISSNTASFSLFFKFKN